MRFVRVIKNLLSSWAAQVILMIITFVTRYFFLMYLGTVYLGLNGLFSNVLSLLRLAELGIGVAISYSLYQPLKDQDHEKIKSIMLLFKRCYTFAAIAIFVVGVALIPVLPSIIKDMPTDMPNIYLYYVLYVAGVSADYIFSYKAVLVNADQKRYLEQTNYSFWYSAMSIVQVVSLALWRSYTVYLVLQVVFTLGQHYCLAKIVDKRYPFMKEKNIGPLDSGTMSSIKKNTLALAFQKLGTVIVNATDNIVLSKYIGLVVVGLYSNYFSIINAINMLVSQIFSAMTASVGDFNLYVDKKEVTKVFYTTYWINFWSYGFCSIALACLLDPFIQVWLGGKYLMETSVVVLLCVNFYLNGMRQSVQNFRMAVGIYWQDKMKPVVEAAVNLVVSIILAQKLGTLGVFLGTTVSVLAVTIWWEPHTLYRYGFDAGMGKYYGKTLLYLLVTAAAGAGTYYLCGLIPGNGLLTLAGKLVVVALVPNVIFLLISCRTSEFRMFVSMLRATVSKKRG
ncbi:MAG: hypothetical protein ACI4DO_10595 [Roseburia sp.]